MIGVGFAQQPEQFPVLQDMILGLLRSFLLELLDKFSGVLAAGQVDKVLHSPVVQAALAPLQLGDDQINLIADLFFVVDDFQTVQQLIKSSRGVGYHWLHGVDGFQRFIDTNRVVDLKMGFMDFGTEPGRTAQHLFKQDTGFYPAQEDQIGDLRDINACGQQINGDRNAGIPLILKALDGLLNLLGVSAAYAAGDLHNGIVVHPVFRVEILEDIHNHIGVLVIHCVDESFALLFRIFGVDVLSDFRQYRFVEGTGNHSFIKLLHIEIQFIIQQFAVGNLSGQRIVNGNGIAGTVVDSLVPQTGVQIVRRIVIHQIAFNHRLPVGVLEYRLTENFGGLQSRCGGPGQSSRHRSIRSHCGTCSDSPAGPDRAVLYRPSPYPEGIPGGPHPR